ncbi:MAG: hypothetical protein ACON42_00875 [Flavobacteriaceae bacterium]
MNEIVIVVIGAVAIVGGVIVYSVVSTATGLEVDENNNFIPDRFEEKFSNLFGSEKEEK